VSAVPETTIPETGASQLQGELLDELPVDTGPVLIRVSPGICEGWGECHKFAREIYPIGPDGKVDLHVLEVPVEYAALARRAASMCPVRAIQVVSAVTNVTGEPA
jgi:ferredoxin